VHSVSEPSELTQWQCHDDSTVEVVVSINYYHSHLLFLFHVTYTLLFHRVLYSPGGGRGRGRKAMSKCPPSVTSPSKSLSVPEIYSSNDLDLGDLLSDEEDLPAGDTKEELSPVLEVPVVHITPLDEEEPFIKSEPLDDVDDSTAQPDLPASFRFTEHSYSFRDHSLSADDSNPGVPLVREEPLSRTSGLKYAGSELYGVDDDMDNMGVNVVVQLRKKRAPPITNRLIIPVLRVARSALTERNVLEDLANETDIAHDFARHDASNGTLPCCSFLCLRHC